MARRSKVAVAAVPSKSARLSHSESNNTAAVAPSNDSRVSASSHCVYAQISAGLSRIAKYISYPHHDSSRKMPKRASYDVTLR